jgi:adenylate cyclase
VQLALEMRDRSRELSAEWRRRGHQLELGIGISIGFATCGQIGFEGRYDYSAIGTVTNLSNRLCSEAQGGQILVSQRVFAMVEDRVQAELVGELEFKGISRPVPTYSITGLRV